MADEIFKESTTVRIPPRVWTAAVREFALYHRVPEKTVTKAEAVVWCAEQGIRVAYSVNRDETLEALKAKLKTERAPANERDKRS